MNIDHAPQRWCAVCMQSWRQDMIAIRLHRDAAPICGDCVQRAAKLVAEEQARRDEAAALKRGEA